VPEETAHLAALYQTAIGVVPALPLC
jgi:hypothetical protein